MSISQIKKNLLQLDKIQLIDILLAMYDNNKASKEYLEFYFNPDQEQLFKKYCNKVIEAFSMKRKQGVKIKDAKQAISDYKKYNPRPYFVVAIMLLYVQSGVSYANVFGYVEERMFLSLESTFLGALTLLHKEKLHIKFFEAINIIVEKSKNFGWFGESLNDIYIIFTQII